MTKKTYAQEAGEKTEYFTRKITDILEEFNIAAAVLCFKDENVEAQLIFHMNKAKSIKLLERAINKIKRLPEIH